MPCGKLPKGNMVVILSWLFRVLLLQMRLRLRIFGTPGKNLRRLCRCAGVVSLLVSSLR